jgi:hypothetical protein
LAEEAAISWIGDFGKLAPQHNVRGRPGVALELGAVRQFGFLIVADDIDHGIRTQLLGALAQICQRQKKGLVAGLPIDAAIGPRFSMSRPAPDGRYDPRGLLPGEENFTAPSDFSAGTLLCKAASMGRIYLSSRAWVNCGATSKHASAPTT